jgi:hypothetical protein
MVAKANNNVSTTIKFRNLKQKKIRIKRDKENQKKKTFQLRLSELEFSLFQEKMREASYSNMSDFIRTKCIEPNKLQQYDFLKLAYEVNRIGNNLNQITKKLHTEKRFSEEISIWIEAINEQLTALLKESRLANDN